MPHFGGRQALNQYKSLISHQTNEQASSDNFYVDPNFNCLQIQKAEAGQQSVGNWSYTNPKVKIQSSLAFKDHLAGDNEELVSMLQAKEQMMGSQKSNFDELDQSNEGLIVNNLSKASPNKLESTNTNLMNGTSSRQSKRQGQKREHASVEISRNIQNGTIWEGQQNITESVRFNLDSLRNDPDAHSHYKRGHETVLSLM